jgi:flavodoxin
MKKDILVLYFSRQGNTRLIAKIIADNLIADVEEINYEKRKGFFSGFMKKGKSEEEQIESNTVKSFERYNTLVIGTPVWYLDMPGVVKNYFSKNIFSNKNVALFCSHNGTPGVTIEKMEDKFSFSNNVFEKIDFELPRTVLIEDNIKSCREEIIVFCDRIKNKLKI